MQTKRKMVRMRKHQTNQVNKLEMLQLAKRMKDKTLIFQNHSIVNLSKLKSERVKM